MSSSTCEDTYDSTAEPVHPRLVLSYHRCSLESLCGSKLNIYFTILMKTELPPLNVMAWLSCI